MVNDLWSEVNVIHNMTYVSNQHQQSLLYPLFNGSFAKLIVEETIYLILITWFQTISRNSGFFPNPVQLYKWKNMLKDVWMRLIFYDILMNI